MDESKSKREAVLAPRFNLNVFSVLTEGLDDALTHHGMCHFHEAGDVGALHVVDVALFFTIF